MWLFVQAGEDRDGGNGDIGVRGRVHHRNGGTVMRLVLTLSFTIIPRPVSSPFPSSQGFQLSILSKVLPEPDFTDHRVDGADSGSPGGRRPHHLDFQTTSISSRTCTSRNSDHVPRLHPSLHVSTSTLNCFFGPQQLHRSRKTVLRSNV